MTDRDWFRSFPDADSLLAAATVVQAAFAADVRAINPDAKLASGLVVDTTPYLIFIDDEDTAHLPLWHEVIPEQQEFFRQVAGEEATSFFGLFFNGFFLPHELGHALDDGRSPTRWEGEHLANLIAYTWCEHRGYSGALDRGAVWAERFMAATPFEVPGGADPVAWFEENYWTAIPDPWTYGWLQWGQYLQIHQDPDRPTFEQLLTRLA
jgi:hypothetical protein